MRELVMTRWNLSIALSVLIFGSLFLGNRAGADVRLPKDMRRFN